MVVMHRSYLLPIQLYIFDIPYIKFKHSLVLSHLVRPVQNGMFAGNLFRDRKIKVQ